MKVLMLCGPTVGCGKVYEVEADGREHNCPHCGHYWGRAPLSADRCVAVGPGVVVTVEPAAGLPWECTYCGARYAEYINGCPKCWMGEPGTASSVVLASRPAGGGDGGRGR